MSTEQILEWLTRTALLLSAFIPAIAIHEYAHAQAATWFGDSTAKHLGRLTLNPFAHLDWLGTLALVLVGFGWGKPVPVNRSLMRHPAASMWVALAGPISNVFLAVLFAGIVRGLLFLQPTFPEGIGPPLWQLLVASVQINLVLVFFNLIPLFPLDGSYVLEYALPRPLGARVSAFNQEHGPNILMMLILVGVLTRVSVFAYLISPPANYSMRLLLG